MLRPSKSSLLPPTPLGRGCSAASSRDLQQVVFDHTIHDVYLYTATPRYVLVLQRKPADYAYHVVVYYYTIVAKCDDVVAVLLTSSFVGCCCCAWWVVVMAA
jgi:hypothetical protein